MSKGYGFMQSYGQSWDKGMKHYSYVMFLMH